MQLLGAMAVNRIRYLVEATTSFGDRDEGSTTGIHKDYCRNIDQAESTAQDWANCQYHDNVRVFVLDIGEEITHRLDVDIEDQQSTN
jgi:hypothetical protein